MQIHATPTKHMPNIFLFHGPDNYQSSQKLKLWHDEFVKKFGEEAIEVITAKELDKAQFLTNIQALPFLCEKRLIIVKDYLSLKKTEEYKHIAQNLDKSEENCILIFHENGATEKTNPIYKKIQKIGKVEEFKGMSINEVAKWIMEKARQDKMMLDSPTAFYLSEQCGPDLWNLSSELEKLRLFASGKPITKEMINQLCIISLSSSIFKLIDLIGQKNRKKSIEAITLLEYNDEDMGKIFYMIVRHFRILIQVMEMLKKGENQTSIAKKLGQHPFVIQKTLNQCKNFKPEEIEKIYQKLLEIDLKSKTGIIKTYKSDNREFKLAIEHLIIGCCTKN